MKVLIRPVITEKSMQDAANFKYSFQVAKSVNKHQIENAIKDLYKVEIIKTNIIVYKPNYKKSRSGKIQIKNKSWKKAIVTTKKGQKIEGFEIKE